MKAYVHGGPPETHGFRFSEDTPKPIPEKLGKGQVLCRIMACACNPYDYVPMNRKKDLPGGHDFAGIVMDSKSDKFPVGSKVFGSTHNFGPLAELCIVNENDISMKPESLTFIEASSLTICALTALQGLIHGGVKRGSTVLVVGASGGVGAYAVQIARTLVGPEGKVGAICGTANMEKVRALGKCDVMGDYRQPDLLLDPTSSPLKALQPISCVIDCVSSFKEGDIIKGMQYRDALQPFMCTSPATQYIAFNGTVGRWIRMMMGCQSKSNYFMFIVKGDTEQMSQIAKWCDDKSIVPVIDSVHPFTPEGCLAAYDKVYSRRAMGKVCIDVQGGNEI